MPATIRRIKEAAWLREQAHVWCDDLDRDQVGHRRQHVNHAPFPFLLHPLVHGARDKDGNRALPALLGEGEEVSVLQWYGGGRAL